MNFKAYITCVTIPPRGTEAKEALLVQRLHDLPRQDVCALIEGSSTEKSHQNRQFSLKNQEWVEP